MRSKSRLGRPVDADSAATRARICSEARRAFAEIGFAATTFRLLAERTALSPSALYNYFDSKAELYAVVHDEVKAAVYGLWIGPAIAGTTTFAARIDALLTAIYDMNVVDPTTATFLASARVDTVRHGELATVREALPAQRQRLFAELVDLGIATGEIDESARARVLALLEAMNLGLLELAGQPRRHRVAIDAYRRLMPAAVAALADGPMTIGEPVVGRSATA